MLYFALLIQLHFLENLGLISEDSKFWDTYLRISDSDFQFGGYFEPQIGEFETQI